MAVIGCDGCILTFATVKMSASRYTTIDLRVTELDFQKLRESLGFGPFLGQVRAVKTPAAEDTADSDVLC